ncbi:MAG: DUF5916 domain-containing protein [Bacteroidales bacterium]|jgi:hypothetical protein|nr:DUF5916 domain-containing protein [Bacteroidales bacterium]
MKKSHILFILLAASLPIYTHGQNSIGLNLTNPLKVNRISGKINFDGIPDEIVWQNTEALPFVMFMPNPGSEPSESSIVRMGYDEEYFYVSGILNYQDMKYLRAIGKQRDYLELSTDWFGFTLDTFNDRENAVQFSTNPNGLRRDATIKNDCLVETNDRNYSWNTFWDVKTNIGDHAWSAEFRIPFSSLRFLNTKGKTTMGIILLRWMAAKSELITFPTVSPDYATPYYKPSLSKVIEFEGLKPKKPVYLAPYIIAGAGQVNELYEDESQYGMNTTPKLDIGGDIKYSITNNLTLDLTVNTDFAQVEADDQMINLTRYSLYFPEKRIFFLEKSDVFDFSFLQGDNLFYSRRIGLLEGNAVRIYGGARLTGRIGKWDLGLFDMQTAKFEDNPDENFGVIRLKRNVVNQNSYVGGMITSRLGMNGTFNTAYGLDGQFRVKGNDYLILRMAQSFENEADNKILEMSPTRLLFQWQRRSQVDLGYDIQYIYSGENYNPGIGFERKKSYQGPNATILYGWLPKKSSFLYTHRISLSGYNFWNSETGLHETTNATLNWFWQTKKAYGGNISLNWFTEKLLKTLPLGNNQASVPQGSYSFAYLTLDFQSSRSKKLSSTLSSTTGSFYDGWRLSFYAAPTYKIGSDFNVGLTYYLDYVDFSKRNMSFTNHILGVKGEMTLTTATLLKSFIQYNTAINRFIINVRFRFNPSEGNDLWIVYDEGLNTNLQREIPELPVSAGRTLLIKYTYTFRL